MEKKNKKDAEFRRRMILLRTVLPLVATALMLGIALSFFILSAIIKDYELLISVFIVCMCFFTVLFVAASELTYTKEKEKERARLRARKERR